jgi:hypothetical protein
MERKEVVMLSEGLKYIFFYSKYSHTTICPGSKVFLGPLLLAGYRALALWLAEMNN